MIFRTLSTAIAAAWLLAMPCPADAQLQTSQTHKFLEAVRDAKGQDVTEMLNEPGSTVVNVQDPGSGEGALHIVVKRGDTTYLRFLLQKGADPNIRDRQGVTPLLTAVNEGQDGCIAVLIDANADVNRANDRGETPLIRAVQRRDVNMVRELLAAGANPDQTDNLAGQSARDYAHADTRTPGIAKLIDDAPKTKKRAISGPKLR